MAQKGKDLKMMLERVQEGFAYEVMALQIEVEEKGDTANVKIDSISRLLQLYMIGVEVLESKSDPRYLYFNAKIQNLMKKRIILEEMQRSTASKMESQIIQEAKKAQMGEKKEDYRLQMYLNKEQVNQKKVRQIVDIAESKLKRLQSRVQGSMMTQDKELQERIRRRKMRSQAGSVEKFKLVKGQVVDRNIVNDKIEDFFDPWEVKLKKKEITGGSGGKDPKRMSEHHIC